MKKHLLIFFSIIVVSCFSQEKGMNHEFVVYGSRLSYFAIYNSTDTSILAGKYRIKNDTVYFEEILDTLIAGGVSYAKNTSGVHHTTSIAKPNFIALSFHYLDKYAPLMYMPHLNYQFMGDSIYSSICKNSHEIDTVHFIPYTPGAYNSIVFENYKFTYGFYGAYAPPNGRKKRKLDKMIMIMDFLNFDFVVYFSDKKFDFDIKQLTSNYVMVRGVKYPIVFNE